MLFVNISQAPFIVTITLFLFLLIIIYIIRKNKLLARFFSKEQQQILSKKRSKVIAITKNTCLFIISLMLGISLLDPRGSSLSSDIELEGIDIVLVYDVSRSMDVQDTKPSRLNFAKELGEQLVDTLTGNRVGLVAYAADALRLLPLTTDISSIDLFIRELNSDMIGSQSTDIGKALDEAVKTFNEDTLTHKAIVLFTDGENLDGNVKTSVDLIKQQGITMFIVGLGTENGAAVPIYNPRTGQTNNLTDLLGKEIISKLDSKYLQDLANKTEGTYILGSRTTINQIGDLIDKIKKSPFGTNTQNYLEPKFRAFMLIALLALLLYLFLPDKKLNIKFSLLFLLILKTTFNYSITTEHNAYSAYKQEEYSSALRFYQRSLVNNPKNIKSKFGEAATLYKLDRNDRAEKAFLSLTNNENTNITQKSLFNAANSRVKKEDYNGALALYKKVLADNRPDSDLYKKALNNYIYTRALQQSSNSQNNKQDQNNQQSSNSQNDKQDQNNQQSSNSQNDKQDQNNQQSSNSQNDKQDQNNQQSSNSQNDKQDQNNQQKDKDQTPSHSVSPNDIDNILGLAQEDEKANFSKQHKAKKEMLQKNKY